MSGMKVQKQKIVPGPRIGAGNPTPKVPSITKKLRYLQNIEEGLPGLVLGYPYRGDPRTSQTSSDLATGRERIQARADKLLTPRGRRLAVVVRKDLEMRIGPSAKARVAVNPWRKGVSYLIHPEIWGPEVQLLYSTHNQCHGSG